MQNDLLISRNKNSYRKKFGASFFAAILVLTAMTTISVFSAPTVSAQGPPVADANGPYFGYTGETVTLDGSGSYDPDGTIVLYEWDFDGDGTYDWSAGTASQGIASHSYPLTGTYNPVLRVTNDSGLTDTDTADVLIVEANPELSSSCGVDMALVLDSSGSIDTGELATMKSAFILFVDAFLPRTPTQMSVTEFDDTATVRQTFTSDIDDIKAAINGAVSGGCTNWEDALIKAHGTYDPRVDKPDLMIFASDGNPNTVVGGSGCGATEEEAMAAAIAAANAIKADGIRIITLGIGADLNPDNLIAISSADAYYETNFDTLAEDLANLSAELCGGTVTVQKFVDGVGAEDWEFAATVTGGTATPTSGFTDADGYIVFNIDLDQGVDEAMVDITETLKLGFTFENAVAYGCDGEVGTLGYLTITDIPVSAECAIYAVFNNSERTDDTPPIQTFEVGNPNITRIWMQNEYYVIGPCTPIWINSTDNESGSDRIEYSVWLANDLNQSPITWIELPQYHSIVYDEDDGDEDGVVHAEFYLDETCLHEIRYQCWDKEGNTAGLFSTDLFVDKCTPVIEKEVGIPQYGVGVIQPPWANLQTPLTFTTYDRCCLPGGTGVKSITILVWWKENTCNDSGALNVIETIYVEDGDANDTDPREGFVGYEFHFKQSGWYELEYWAEDIMCNIGGHMKQQHRVDTDPPKITKTHPDHGYLRINDTYGYLKCDVPITLEAEDMPDDTCNVGLAGLFWRYEFNGTNYPLPGEGGAVNGADIALQYNFSDPEIEDYWWYNYTDDIRFFEECQHDLYYFAIDNIGNYEAHHQVYYVDDTEPYVEVEYPDHGYYEDAVDHLKIDTPITLAAYENPDNLCQADIESIFYRYEWDGLMFPSGPGTGIVHGTELVSLYDEDYNIPAITDYYWYRVNDSTVDISFLEECQHDLIFFAKDNVCHRSELYYLTFYVDGQAPELDIMYPEHGYYTDDVNHLKCNTTITLKANDLPENDCAAGIESIFWRYEYEGDPFPYEPGEGIIHGDELVTLYGDDYDIADITDYFWYLVNESSTDIWFEEECYHELFWFAKDNVCQRTEIWYSEYYVDDTGPWAEIEFSEEHGYYQDDDDRDHIKGGMEFSINAYDLPENECMAGIESIFYRYEWNLTMFPSGPGTGIVNGADLVGLYGENYNIPEITDYYWYRVDDNTVDISFLEECQHDLFFFAKDNVCHRSEIYDRTIYVDCTEPDVWLELPPGHGYYPIDETSGYIREETQFTIKAEDFPENDCAVGIESIFFRYEWNDGEYPNGPGPFVISGDELGIMYGYTDPAILNYWWYYTNSDNISIDFYKQCQHDFYYWAKDNVCHRTDIYEHTFYVDDMAPMVNDYPPMVNHGLYIDDEDIYLKCGLPIYISAMDLPRDSDCDSGIESIFWRYEWDGQMFPVEGEENAINGTALVDLYGDSYDIPEITDYWWYLVDDILVEIIFAEECEHTIYYFAKDNVCHRTDVYDTTYYIDCSGPEMDMDLPEHGYIKITETSGSLKGGESVYLNAYDLPDNDCAAGIESIFWRYEWENTSYPVGYDPGIVSGWDLVMWYGEDYNISDITDYFWYRVDDNTVDISFFEECQHDLFFFAKDNVCNRGPIYQHTFFVDDAAPGLEVVYPDHGYYEESFDFPLPPIRHLKCYIPITINAFDFPESDCAAGIESIFWRYEWNGTRFPSAPGTGIVSGEELYLLYGEAYLEPAIYNYYWYRVDDDTVDITFEEECQHDLYFFAKDNVCHPSWIWGQTYYVDNSDPYVDVTFPDHGYYPINDTSGYLKCYTPITLTPYDLPENECAAGIETLFWRYEFNGGFYPFGEGEGVIHGSDLAAAYGYTDPEIIDNWWFWSPEWVEINFTEECQHELYFFTKDNVCHHSDIYHWTFYVDNTPPLMELDLPDHGYYEVDEGIGHLKCYSPFWVNVTDFGECQAGIESIFWRYEYDGDFYPDEPGMGIISGNELAQLYGYTDPNITEFWWYFVNSTSVELMFEEECQHDLYWFAKDNVCHPTDVFHHTFLVDNSDPEAYIIPPQGHGYYGGDVEFLKCDTPISISAYDLPENECMAGIESIFYRYEWNDLFFPDGPGTGIVSGIELVGLYGDDYNIPDITGYFWYRVDDDSVDITFMEECEHELFYFVKDNVCHRSSIYDESYYVDCSGPEIDITHPDHGYIEIDEASGYLKAGISINLEAFDKPDNDCAAGIESIFWRYEWDNTSYPIGYDPGIVSGWDLVMWYGEDYNISDITDYFWYRVDDNTVDILFFEECQHDLFFFAKDNVCNRGPIYHRTYFVDDSEPELTKIHPEDGYAYINEKNYIKCDTPITITATDDGDCQAGVESIFWRYEFDGEYFPSEPGAGVVSGDDLVAAYGDDYYDDSIYFYLWYRVDSDSVEIRFYEDCIHDLFYFAKDNVCHPTDVHHQTYYVDCTPPETTKDVEGPTCVADEDDIALFNLTGSEITDFWIRDNDTLIILNTEDYEEPCASGINYMHIELWWDEDNNMIFDEDELLWDHEIDGTSYEFKIMEDCLHKIVWYSVDLVGNAEEPNVQYHRVDSTPPESVKTFDGPTYPAEDYPDEMYGPDLGENYWVTSETEINLTAVDQTWPCASGVVGFHVKVEWDPECDGFFDIVLLNEDIPSSPYSVIFTFKELVDDYYGYEVDCYEGEYRITWSSYDCLNNIEEEKIQYHRVDDTPPHVVILKPTDGWYSDGECIPAVVFSEDLNSPHCGYEQCGTVGIEDGKQGFAYLIDIFPEFKIVELDSTNFLYDADSHEFIGNVCIPEESGITDGIVIFVAGVEDNLGNDWDSIREMIHAIVIQALAECMDESCCMELIADLWADFVIDQNLVFIGIDNTPPEVEILETEVELGTIYVKANATDVLSGIVTGTPCYVTLGGVEIGTLPYDSTMGGCEGTLPTAGVPDGEQLLSVCVADRAGSVGCDSVIVDLIPLPGPTTSGTDVIPDPAIIGEDPPVVIATVHSTISEVVGAEYFISNDGTKGPDGTGTPLFPVDGTWDGTTEDITATLNITELHGVYTIYVHGLDADGRWGAYDEEEFAVLYEWEIRDVILRIEIPEDGDEFYVDTENGNYSSRFVHVVVDTRFDDDYGYEDVDELTVKIYLDDPYGAPDQYYEVFYDEMAHRFYADIDIYKYSSGSILDIHAEAEDESGWNRAEDHVSITVFTTVEFDRWMEEGWNGPINIAVQGCDDSVESVFASIDGYCSWIFEVETWKNYHYGEGGNTLHVIDPDAWYWVKMDEAARFFIDANAPFIEIETPDDSGDGDLILNSLPQIDGTAWDIETGVADVSLQIYYTDGDTYYWDDVAMDWVTTPTDLTCNLDTSTYYQAWDYNSSGIAFINNKTFTILATATDKAGCQATDMVEFLWDDNPPIVEILDPQDGETRQEGPDDIDVEAYDLETEVTDVYIEVYDVTSGLYYDGATWQGDQTGLPCTYDMGDEWYYETNGMWSGLTGHTFDVTAKAYDIPGNIGYDTNTFTIEEPEGECIPSKTWTTTADFNEGTIVGLNSSNDQLELILGEVTTYPSLWVANAGEDSLSKWDTSTNKEIARYHTWFGPLASHDAWSGPAPSRTCVDSDGNCYVANRQFSTLKPDVIKIYTDDWVDRNGNGVLDTSYDANGSGAIEPGEMLPMTDSNSNGKIDPDEIVDERIAWATQVEGNGRGRSLAIDLEGNIWLGCYDSRVYYKLDKDDGSILGGPYSVGNNNPYGALVDKHGYLWGSDLGSDLLKMNTSDPSDYTVYSVPYIYGIALGYDAQDNTLAYLGGNTPYYVFNSSSETYSAPAEPVFSTLGIATDSQGNIVVGDNWNGGVAKFAPNGTKIWEVSGQINDEVRGIVVDSDDNIWAMYLYDFSMGKYDGTNGAPLGVFDTGRYPYTYSDATGIGFASSIASGRWNDIFDSEAADTQWDMVTWTEDVPEDTSITVEVRSSNDGISWSPWEDATNGGALNATPDGRYVEVKATLKSTSTENAPILYDITVDGTCAYQPEEPSVFLEKTVWDEDLEEWVNETDVMVNETALFNISIHNDGNCDLGDWCITDTLLEGLEYVENSTVLTVISGDYYEQSSGPEAQPQAITHNPDNTTMLEWWETGYEGFNLTPCTWMYIEFEATVLNCVAPEGHINTANITAYSLCGESEVSDEDDATVWGICEEPDEPLEGSGATIDPDTITVTLCPGESIEEHKNVTTDEIPIGKLDVLFLFDLTGSMGDELYEAKASSIDIMNNISAQVADSAFGVGSFMDYPDFYSDGYCDYWDTYGDSYSGDYAWSLDQDITSDTSAVATAINSLILGYGVDGPEAYARALWESQFAGWRTGARKIVIIFEDDDPHDCDIESYGCSDATTGVDPGRDAVAGTSDDLPWADVIADLKAAGISVVAVDSFDSWACPEIWQYATDETGGIFAELGSTSELPDEIVALVENITATIGHLTFEPKAGYEDWFDWTPDNYTDVEGGVTVEFNVTITVPDGTPPGLYHTWLMVIGDGSILAVQEQWITVPEECEDEYAISGDLYYEGEEDGSVIALLFDEFPEEGSIPIQYEIFYPPDIPIPYSFDGLTNGEYYVAAFMDTNSNMTYEIGEPFGYAVNNSWYPDTIVVSGADVTGQDVTLEDPNPSASFMKSVWNESYWDDSTDAVMVGENVRFNITMYNNGNVVLGFATLIDYLPDGLDYVENSTEAIVIMDGEVVSEGSGEDVEPQQIPYAGGMMLTWDASDYNGTYLPPEILVYIEFEATITECADEYVNLANLTAGFYEYGITCEDTAIVIPICEEPNNPPYTPSSPDPWDDETDVTITTDLMWTGGDPDVGDTVTYDVYFGTTSPPPMVVGNQSDTTYDPGTLPYNTTHCWMIVAWDDQGASTAGPEWSFTTEEEISPITHMGIIPSSDTVNVGDIFTATIYINPIYYVGGWEITLLNFTQGLNASEVTIGSEWSGGVYDLGDIDNVNGSITVITAGDFLPNPEDYPGDNHTACEINFTAMQSGLCTIEIVSAEVYRADDMQPMPLITHTATITIT